MSLSQKGPRSFRGQLGVGIFGPIPPNLSRNGDCSMSRRIGVVVALVVLLSATAAWSFFKLAGAGETMGEAANKYLATLTSEQRTKGAIAYDDKMRVDWHFIP